jgi:hypothetical protein
MEEPEQPIDLRVRVALLEQSEVHRDQIAGMHRDMMAARSAAIERQVATIADQQSWMWSKHQQHGETQQESQRQAEKQAEAIRSLGTRQDQHDQLAARLRYTAAAALVLLAAAGQMAPETLVKLVKALGILPL